MTTGALSLVAAMRLSALRVTRQLLLRRRVASQAGHSNQQELAAAYAAKVPGLVLRVAAGVALAVTGTGVALVALLGTPVGLQSVLSFINSQVPGRVEVSEVRLHLQSWHRARIALNGVRVHEPARLGGQLLMSANEVACEGTPWEILSGSPTQYIITGGSLNGGYSASGRDFRVIRYLEAAGVLEPPPPKGDPPTEEVAQGHVDAGTQTGGTGDQSVDSDELKRRSDARSHGSGNNDGGKPAGTANGAREDSSSSSSSNAAKGQVGQGHLQQGQEQAAGSGQVSHGANGNSSQQGAQESRGQEEDEDILDKALHKIANTFGSAGGMEPIGPPEPPVYEEEAELQEIEQGGVFMKVLCKVDSEVGLSGELRQPGLRLVVQDSTLQVSSQMRDILGGHVHIVGAFSPGNLQWLYKGNPGPAPAQPGSTPTIPSVAAPLSTGTSARDLTMASHTVSTSSGSEVSISKASSPSEAPAQGPEGSKGVAASEAVQGPGSASGSQYAFIPLQEQSSNNGYATGSTYHVPKGSAHGSDTSGGADGVWWCQLPTSEVAAGKLEEVRRKHGEGCATPGEWRCMSPNLDMSMRLWEVAVPESNSRAEQDDDDNDKAFTVLHQPAAVALKFTSALGSFGLAAVNPLLGRVSNLSERSQGALKAQFVPDGWVLPYTSLNMYVEPMCLQLGTSPLLIQLISGLRVAGVNLGTPKWLRRTLRSSDAPHHPHSKPRKHKESQPQLEEGEWLNAQAEEQYQQYMEEQQQQQAQQGLGVGQGQGEGPQPHRGLLEAWLSGMHVRIERDGIIEQKRVDMLIGPSGLQETVKRGGRAAAEHLDSAIHLALWGHVDPDTDEVNFVVALPEDLLARMHIKDLPPNYCLPVRLVGSLDTPQLQLKGVGTRITRLLLRQAARIKRSGHERQGHDGVDARGVGAGEAAGSQQPSRQTSSVAARAYTKGQDDGGLSGGQWREEPGPLHQEAHIGSSEEGSNAGGRTAATVGGGEPEGHAAGSATRQGVLRRLWQGVRRVVSVVAMVVAPAGKALDDLQHQLHEEAAQVPPQYCEVPWRTATYGSTS